MAKIRALIRLAWRDTRSHWLRAIIVIGLVAVATVMINAKPLVHLVDEPAIKHAYQRIENAQASVDFAVDKNIIQEPLGRGFDRATSTHDTEDSNPWTVQKVRERAGALRDLAGEAEIVPVIATEYSILAGAESLAYPQFTAVQGPWKYISQGAVIASGRPPQSAGDIAISQTDAEALDISLGDTVRIIRMGPFGDTTEQPVQATVVGLIDGTGIFMAPGTFPQISRVLDTLLSGDSKPLSSADEAIAIEIPDITTFKIVGDTPIDWEQVREANREGLVVTSRAVIANPPIDQSKSEFNWEYETDPLWLLAFSLVASLAIFATALLVPLSILFAQSSIHTGRIVQTVGATRRQWFIVLSLIQAILVSAGIVLGHLLAMVVVWAYFSSRHERLYIVPFSWYNLLSQLVLAVIISYVSARIGYGQVKRAEEARALTPSAPSRRMTVTGVGLLVGSCVLIVLSLVTNSHISLALPLYVTGIALGIVILVPVTFHSLDKRLTRRRASSTERRRSIWKQAASLAILDLRRRRHRTVPAIAAITLATGGIFIVTALFGVSTLMQPDSDQLMDQKHGVIVPQSGTLDKELATQRFERAVDELNAYTTVTAQAILGGNYLDLMTRENAHLMLDTKGDSRLDRLVATRPHNLNDLYVKASDDAVIFRLGARSPDGQYHGCPGANPHSIHPELEGAPETEQQELSCRFLDIATHTSPANTFGVLTPEFLIDDGTFISQSGAQKLGDATHAAEVLRNGGVLVNDPGLIHDGKTTVVLAGLVSSPTFEEIPDPAFSDNFATLADVKDNEDIPVRIELRTLTVPATAYELPDSQGDAVMLSPQAAEQLGLKSVPVAQLVRFDTTPNWWSTHRATQAAHDAVPQVNVVVNAADYEAMMEYVFYLVLLTAIIMFITLMLAILSGLEVRKTLDILDAIGANSAVRRWFGAWYAGITVALGVIGGGLTLTIFYGVTVIANLVHRMLGEPQYLADLHLGQMLLFQPFALVVLPFLAGIVGALVFPRRRSQRTVTAGG
ncbi:MAG: hypothetical protein Q4P71_08360 [Actinomycetaceae bacterium]|nr:hypothetical protein [Actinomycetaceae bacterium]